jgi:hypothetical protein
MVPEQIDRSILVIRGQKVLLDEQLASFYGIPTKALVQAVKRNIERFPQDFAFHLSGEEWGILRSQIVTSSSVARGGRRYPPYAFTEQGVAMLSSVLRSRRSHNDRVEKAAGAIVSLRGLAGKDSRPLMCPMYYRHNPLLHPRRYLACHWLSDGLYLFCEVTQPIGGGFLP